MAMKKSRKSGYRRRTFRNRAALIAAGCAVLAALSGLLLLGISQKPAPAMAPAAESAASAASMASAQQAESQAAPPAGSEAAGENAGTADDWALRLVDKDHLLPADFAPDVVEAGNSYKHVEFDRRAAGALEELMDACNAEGHELMVCSGYRTIAYQEGLFEKQVRKQENLGLSGEEAVAAAATVVEVPGGSEHNLGLAVDFGTPDNQLVDESFDDEPESAWLKANAWKYGFILRYPQGAEDVTGITYEPWHYRYVGLAAAKEIYDRQLTLEAYLGE